jgi:hypothetical protein
MWEFVGETTWLKGRIDILFYKVRNPKLMINLRTLRKTFFVSDEVA